jgi:hypothetical protein
VKAFVYVMEIAFAHEMMTSLASSEGRSIESAISVAEVYGHSIWRAEAIEAPRFGYAHHQLVDANMSTNTSQSSNWKSEPSRHNRCQIPMFCPRLQLQSHYSPHILERICSCLQTTLSDFIAPIQISVIPSLKARLPESQHHHQPDP